MNKTQIEPLTVRVAASAADRVRDIAYRTGLTVDFVTQAVLEIGFNALDGTGSLRHYRDQFTSLAADHAAKIHPDFGC